jgi:hypothetical protein
MSENGSYLEEEESEEDCFYMHTAKKITTQTQTAQKKDIEIKDSHAIYVPVSDPNPVPQNTISVISKPNDDAKKQINTNDLVERKPPNIQNYSESFFAIYVGDKDFITDEYSIETYFGEEYKADSDMYIRSENIDHNKHIIKLTNIKKTTTLLNFKQ